ncbi:MAG TPA: hypothetical protein VGC32_20310 [Solirubrobacterales bacterium]
MGKTDEYDGWWALDLAAYLLSRPETAGGVTPFGLDTADAISWIRDHELFWAPGCADLSDQPWDELRLCPDDAALADKVLARAVDEVKQARGHHAAGGEDAPIDLIARRRIPLSTLLAYGYELEVPPGDHRRADSHVHQGATLPIEVTLHWIASNLRPSTEGSRRPRGRRLKAIGDGEPFDPMPYLACLRLVLESPSRWREGIALIADQPARGEMDHEAFERLIALMPDRAAGNRQLPSLESIVALKVKAAAGDWAADRRVALIRLEAILHGAVTQQAPGLDVFVEAFEDFSSLRRGQLPKKEYYERSILEHTSRSPGLKALELRLGEPIFRKVKPEASTLANDYKDALDGYLRYLDSASNPDHPVRVSFPLGLVKTTPDGYVGHESWRFDPSGVYDVVEALISLLDSCPSLVAFVDGLDVCGNECDAPNWLFAPALERFARWADSRAHPVTLRCHAGEWQPTPLHGLRRIDEFSSLKLPRGTRRRVGHGLALDSNDWSRFEHQPIDELFDDLIWSFAGLTDVKGPSDLIRLIRRQINDLTPIIFPGMEIAGTDILISAFTSRSDPAALRRIGFMAEADPLSFAAGLPRSPDAPPDKVLLAFLESRDEKLPNVGEVIPDLAAASSSLTLERLRLALSDTYDILAPMVREDLKWKQMVVEACPTSNVVVGGVRGFRRHPLKRLAEDGILATLGSDDPSLFHTWIGDEVVRSERLVGVPSRQIASSQGLATEIVAAAVSDEDTRSSIESAIAELDAVRSTVPRR